MVVAASWTAGPGTPISQALLAVPSAACDGEGEEHLYLVAMYLPGTSPADSDPVEEALVRLLIMPGEYLVK
eukprot:4664508-Amphidinium_carterae.1